MEIKAKKGKDGYTLSLSGELTIYTAEDAFIKLFAKPAWFDSNLTINLTNVIELDTAGVQLLFMLIKEVGSSGQVNIEGVSDAVESVLSLLRLQSLCHSEVVSL